MGDSHARAAKGCSRNARNSPWTRLIRPLVDVFVKRDRSCSPVSACSPGNSTRTLNAHAAPHPRKRRRAQGVPVRCAQKASAAARTLGTQPRENVSSPWAMKPTVIAMTTICSLRGPRISVPNTRPSRAPNPSRMESWFGRYPPLVTRLDAPENARGKVKVEYAARNAMPRIGRDRQQEPGELPPVRRSPPQICREHGQREGSGEVVADDPSGPGPVELREGRDRRRQEQGEIDHRPPGPLARCGRRARAPAAFGHQGHGRDERGGILPELLVQHGSRHLPENLGPATYPSVHRTPPPSLVAPAVSSYRSTASACAVPSRGEGVTAYATGMCRAKNAARMSFASPFVPRREYTGAGLTTAA